MERSITTVPIETAAARRLSATRVGVKAIGSPRYRLSAQGTVPEIKRLHKWMRLQCRAEGSEMRNLCNPRLRERRSV